MNQKLPIIEQLHAQRDNRGRADVLLRCPDSVILKYAEVFVAACSGFDQGRAFVRQRVAAMQAVRSGAGGLPGGMAMTLETLRAGLAAIAAGAETGVSRVEGYRVRTPPPSVTDL